VTKLISEEAIAQLSVDDHIVHGEETVTLSIMSIINRGHLLGLLLILATAFTIPFPQSLPNIVLGTAATFMRPVWFLFQRFFKMRITSFYHVGVALCEVCTLSQVYIVAIHFRSPSVLVYALIAFILISGANLLTNPIGGWGAKIHPLVYFIGSVWTLSQSPYLNPAVCIVSFGNYYFLMAATQHFRAYRMAQETKIRMENLKIAQQNAAITRVSLELDLELARQVQEGFMPSRTAVHGKHFASVFFEKKHGVLGGDWMAFRTLDSGETISVLVDATGKGVAAALVIHAIQSLWAESLNRSEFNVSDWIKDVNKTLFQLGRRSAHTVSMGVVVVTGDILTYYSAGHVPLYLIRDVNGASVVTTLASRGSLLGMSEAILIFPKSIDLISNSVRCILSGTDGVFIHGTRTSPRHVLRLVKELESRGENALSLDIVEDDKLLLWMTRVA
jgi:hypothetical protein